jgi:hypothetical protein
LDTLPLSRSMFATPLNERTMQMRIDNAMQQQISSPAARQAASQGMQPQKEVAGEQENDGDADDSAKSTARTAPASQLYAQGIGNKVDLLA